MLRISVRREAHRAHRLDVNVESPTGTSCSDPHGAHVLLEVHADSPTSNLKLKLADIWPEFASEATVLVHCGRVLGDWKPLADYVVQGGTVWWLRSCRGRSPVWSDSLAGSDAESLRSLFPINGLAPSQAQQPNLPSNLCRVVKDFFQSLSAPEAPFNSTEQESLAKAGAALQSTSPEPAHVKWFPEYACALISTVEHVGVVNLRLVSLDGWQFHMHAGSTGRTHCGLAGSDAAVALCIDPVPRCRWEEYCSFADELLAKAKTRTAEKRSAEGNAQGNQKTPAMIQAVLIDARLGLDNHEVIPKDGLTKPRGGFTDVGLHTGGLKRNTMWPLIRAVLQNLLEEQGARLLHLRAMALLRLWLTELQLSSLTVDDAVPSRIDTIMNMLGAVVDDGAELSERGFDMEAFESRCALVRCAACCANHTARPTASLLTTQARGPTPAGLSSLRSSMSVQCWPPRCLRCLLSWIPIALPSAT